MKSYKKKEIRKKESARQACLDSLFIEGHWKRQHGGRDVGEVRQEAMRRLEERTFQMDRASGTKALRQDHSFRAWLGRAGSPGDLKRVKPVEEEEENEAPVGLQMSGEQDPRQIQQQYLRRWYLIASYQYVLDERMAKGLILKCPQ